MERYVVPADDGQHHQRNGAIYREWLNGRSQRVLAQKYNLTQPRISQIIREVREKTPPPDREEEIRRSFEMLQELRAGALEIWEMAAAPMVAGRDGDPVQDPESGEYVRDHAGRLRALETALKVDQRISQLLGLDAAVKMDHTVSTTERQAADRLAQDAAARLNQEDE